MSELTEMTIIGLLLLIAALEILFVLVMLLAKVMVFIFVRPILKALDNYEHNRNGFTFYLIRRRGYSGYSEMSEWQSAHEEYIKQKELWEYCVPAMRKIEKAGHYEVAWFLMTDDERKKWTSFLEDFSNTYCALSEAQAKLEELEEQSEQTETES